MVSSTDNKSNRFFKRTRTKIPVEIRLTNNHLSLVSLFGYVTNLSQGGVCLLTKNTLPLGADILLNSVSYSLGPIHSIKAQIVSVHDSKGDEETLYGLAFTSLERNDVATLGKFLSKRVEEGPLLDPIKLIIACSFISFFLLIFALGKNFLGTPIKYFIPLFILLVGSERIFETFFTTREQKPTKHIDDWSIVAVTSYYALMLTLTTLEFFTMNRRINYSICYLGLCLFFSAMVLRWWAMKTLGGQWAIHVIGQPKTSEQKIKKEIIRSGPYKYVRHPIYLGVLVELISIPLVANAFYTLVFVSLVNVPLQYLRSKLEEKHTLDLFGKGYEEYMSQVGAFLPHLTNRIHPVNDRRQTKIIVDFADRRSKKMPLNLIDRFIAITRIYQ